MAKKTMSFEDSMQRLDEIVRLLESGNVSLEESLKLFEEGTALSAKCSTLLDQAEQKILKLTSSTEQAPTMEVVQNEQQLSD